MSDGSSSVVLSAKYVIRELVDLDAQNSEGLDEDGDLNGHREPMILAPLKSGAGWI